MRCALTWTPPFARFVNSVGLNSFQDEAIDELAEFVGKGAQVRAFTATAMNGGLPFGESLQKRMEMLELTKPKLDQFLKQHPIRLTPGIQQLIPLLHSHKIPVFLVSGGFREVIEPIAQQLNVPKENIYANRIVFDEKTGAYIDFDRSEPTSDSGDKTKGKARVCGLLKAKYGFNLLVMVGDGATDLEASPPADLFIGFGGNQVRAKVKERSPWFVTQFEELIQEFQSSKHC